MRDTLLDSLACDSAISFRLTKFRPEAESAGDKVQGDGPWWMCQVAPVISHRCQCCGHCSIGGYFKAASHDFEVSLALALSRMEVFRKSQSVNVARSEEVQAADRGKAEPK